jgi:hypothetical protein
VTVAGPAGNADGDDKVDGADLASWQRHYSPMVAAGSTFALGDWNFDDKIDGADLALWQSHYDPIGASEASVSAIPEPATMMLLAGGLVVLGRRRFSRRRWNDNPHAKTPSRRERLEQWGSGGRLEDIQPS